MDKLALYRQALQVFGYDKQLCKLAEEASELAAESNRLLNHQGLERRLACEMADVEIMIEQFRHNGLASLIDFHKQQKLERLAKRLGVTYEQ
ncbi:MULTISPECIES: hypothetical protein [unclassified Serratia (in: enterobacteria)]|uniref:hypothetical protein n=1 Tax=unclassified Serratia (in: enterobacteria) TaxID=2647522 RepID=UPI0005081205|nr:MULTISPECIES: hypothetical protein [unclassified Serratia (in: enterobacteria)]KFK92785.1 hypothetical protein JV45_19425 [Serratia sp. Ag2]KFK98547.1 hypothetical protein IV04_11865 [Serratia sp. Ag1]